MLVLKLDENKFRRGKVCKFYDSLSFGNLFFVKITSPSLINENWYNMLEKPIEEGFIRCYENEFPNVQMKENLDFAWIEAPIPEQAK